jgi:hypothetical protein
MVQRQPPACVRIHYRFHPQYSEIGSAFCMKTISWRYSGDIEHFGSQGLAGVLQGCLVCLEPPWAIGTMDVLLDQAVGLATAATGLISPTNCFDQYIGQVGVFLTKLGG